MAGGDLPADIIRRLRAAADAWALVPPRRRVRITRRITWRLIAQARVFCRESPRPWSETITAELLPLVSAARFLTAEGPSLLRERRLRRRGTPLWLIGTRARVERRPHGVVLILAPGNYPLMLGGIHALQALIAGNAVALKPAPGTASVLKRFISALIQSGLPKDLVTVLHEADGPAASRADFDLTVLTGSVTSGRAVADAAAARLRPTIMELSGIDSSFILPRADLAQAAQAIAFGVRFNAGATCIAPRRIFVLNKDRPAFLTFLTAALLRKPVREVPPSVALQRLVILSGQSGGASARIGGVTVIQGGASLAPLLVEDVFEPWLAVIAVSSVEEARRLDEACPYALGASIFGPVVAAEALARQLPAGSICINDVVVPTADPRLPFGGARRSGFGTTRGREGLLAMTRPVSVSRRDAFAFFGFR